MWSPICEIYEEVNKPKIDKNEAKELLDKLYDIAYDEAFKDAYKNVGQIVEGRKIKNELANKLYHAVQYKDVEKLIKRDLPLRIRLLNKVSVIGKSLRGNTVAYTYCFNNNHMRSFEYIPHLYELEQLIK